MPAPPPEVAAAYKVLSDWVTEQEASAATKPAPPVLSAAQRFAQIVRSDVPPVLPAWKDARPDQEFVRWKNPRG